MTAKPIKTLTVHGADIALKRTKWADYISLTDIARSRDAEHANDLVRDWLKNRNTVEFLGIWESLQNPNFDVAEFDAIRAKAGLNSFSLSPRQWIQRTGAIGLIVHTGQRAGAYAHPDIAFEFASWLSVEFKLYLTKEFQRLRLEADEEQALSWQLNRVFSKVSSRLHSQAIRANLIPGSLSPEQAAQTYGAEADLVNVALFGMTAREWREANPTLTGNMRDHATLEQLLVLVNLQTVNAELIRLGVPQSERLLRLNDLAIRQMEALVDAPTHPKTIGEQTSEAALPPRVRLRLVESLPVDQHDIAA
ncbi:MAG: KilA-N domain-containing protein [Thermomicrobiales bacterium]